MALSDSTVVELVEAAIEKAARFRDANPHDPNVGREFSLAITALEDAAMRFTRGYAKLTSRFSVTDLQAQDRVPAAPAVVETPAAPAVEEATPVAEAPAVEETPASTEEAQVESSAPVTIPAETPEVVAADPTQQQSPSDTSTTETPGSESSGEAVSQ